MVEASSIATVVGIDPGLDGGLACLSLAGDVVAVTPMPVAQGRRRAIHTRLIQSWLSRCPAVKLVGIEAVTAMRNWGVVGTFEFGVGFGRILGVVEAACLPLELVRPREWQTRVLGPVPKGKSKVLSIAFAQRRFPGVDLSPGRRSRPHDGIADALGIAEWTRRRIMGAAGGES